MGKAFLVQDISYRMVGDDALGDDATAFRSLGNDRFVEKHTYAFDVGEGNLSPEAAIRFESGPLAPTMASAAVFARCYGRVQASRGHPSRVRKQRLP